MDGNIFAYRLSFLNEHKPRPILEFFNRIVYAAENSSSALKTILKSVYRVDLKIFLLKSSSIAALHF